MLSRKGVSASVFVLFFAGVLVREVHEVLLFGEMEGGDVVLEVRERLVVRCRGY